jgi:hypothetical protein
MTFTVDEIGEASAIAGTADFCLPVMLSDGTVGHLLRGVGLFNAPDLSFKATVAASLNARVDLLGTGDVLEALKRGDLRLDP